MSIFPLPQFEADLVDADREAYERLKPPTSMVVRFGAMKMIGEFPYQGDAKPGCGSKVVVRTHRGVELGEMLTSTCPNAGCSKSVTRQQMLEYIQNSGGPDYPFTEDGKVVRIATVEDLNRQSALDAKKPQMVRDARRLVEQHDLPMKIVDAEQILGGELVVFYFTSEQRVDFRELVRTLSREFHARIELRQVGARDEARLIADYERCGQHCCCKNFLKVLKPVSMKAAKVQKATLDPLKISGRCGRLMCCLRYEDETYDTLKKNLPRRGTRVGTAEGAGVVVDGQILTQLVLVELDPPEGDPAPQRKQIAVPVEELVDPSEAPKRAADPFRGMRASKIERRTAPDSGAPPREKQQDAYRERAQRDDKAPARSEVDEIMDALDEGHDAGEPAAAAPGETGDRPAKKRKRRRRKKPGQGAEGAPQQEGRADPTPRPAHDRSQDRPPRDDRSGSARPSRSRRRGRGRRRPGGGPAGDSGAGGGGGGG